MSLRVRDYHPLWCHFPVTSTHYTSCNHAVLQPPHCLNSMGVGSSPVARHYWGNHILFSLPTGTKMFQFPAFAFRSNGMTGLQPAGLSHSEIRGSMVICTYPRLIAAYHVLHRLQEPRHPPYALSYLPAAPEGAVSAGGLYFVYLFCCDRFVDKNFYKTCVCTICQRSMSSLFEITKWRITDSNR